MIVAVELPLRLEQQLREEALRALPRECCGLLEGIVEAQSARVVALHPTRNVTVESDRFEIDPAAHFALLRTLRGTDRRIIGCYHSHPNGRAEPSPRDRDNTAEAGFLWLIAATNPDASEPINLAAFVSIGHAFSMAEIVADLSGTEGRPARIEGEGSGRDGTFSSFA